PPGAAALESVRRGGNLPGAFALESVRRGRGRERSHGWRERAEAKRAGAWSDGERPSGRSRARRPLESAPRATRDRSHAPPRHPRRRARHRAPHGRLRRPGRPAPASGRRALPVRARVPRRRARRHERRPARDRRVRGAPPAVGRPRRGALARRAPRPPRPRPRRAPRGAPARRRPRARPPARDRAHARGRLLRARRVQRRLARRPAALRERAGHAPKPLAGRTAALVFHKPSLRTRVSFTVGMHELGGDAVDLGAAEVSEHGRESLADVAHVLSGMCDVMVVRTFAHRIVQRLAEHARIPVINALTDFSHPCQILADLYTLRRAGRDLDSLTIAWVGDGNNVLNSWLEAATLFGFSLRIAVPDGFEPDAGLYLEAERRRVPGGATREAGSGFGNGAGNGVGRAPGRAPREAGPGSDVRRFRDPAEAVLGADVVYTDTR